MKIHVKSFEGHVGRPGRVGGSLPRGGYTLPTKQAQAYKKAMEFTRQGDVAGLEILSDDEFKTLDGVEEKDIAFYHSGDKKIYVNALRINYAPDTAIAHEVGHAIVDRLADTQQGYELIRLWEKVSKYLSGPQITDPTEGVPEMFAIMVTDQKRLRRMIGDDSDTFRNLVSKEYHGKVILKGGEGSGFHGHEGRPGMVGGSQSEVTYNEQEERARVDYEGRFGRETIGEWLDRSEVKKTEDGRYIFYHGTPKVGGATTALRNGSMLALDPKDAVFYAKRDRNLRNKDIIVYKLALRPSQINGGVFASLREAINLDESVLLKEYHGKVILKGGEGSGFHGHEGRPGEVGGSASQANYDIDAYGRSDKYRQEAIDRIKEFRHNGMSDKDLVYEGYRWRYFAHRPNASGWDWAMWEEIQKVAKSMDFEYIKNITNDDVFNDPYIDIMLLSKDYGRARDAADAVITDYRNVNNKTKLNTFLKSDEGKLFTELSQRQLWESVVRNNGEQIQQTGYEAAHNRMKIDPFPGMQDLLHAKTFEEAKNTLVTVYRGVHYEKDINTQIKSYTSSPQIAKLFAEGYYESYNEPGTGTVYTRNVRFGDILAYINPDGEYEIILHRPIKKEYHGKVILKGGEGSGHRGHEGRPGMVGGSQAEGGATKLDDRFKEHPTTGWMNYQTRGGAINYRGYEKKSKYNATAGYVVQWSIGENGYDRKDGLSEQEAIELAMQKADELDVVTKKVKAPKINKRKMDIAESLYSKLAADETAHNIMVGLMADGTFPDIMNINSSIDMHDRGGYVDPDDDRAISLNFEDLKFSASTTSEIKSLLSDFDVARHAEGWDRYNKKTESARLEWERKYYGRTFEDHEDAEGWAEDYLNDYIKGLSVSKEYHGKVRFR